MRCGARGLHVDSSGAMIVDQDAYDAIVPSFRGSPKVSVSDITVDVSALPASYAQDSPLNHLVSTAKRVFDRHGAVLITNSGLAGDLSAMQKIAESVMGGVMQYEGGANSVTLPFPLLLAPARSKPCCCLPTCMFTPCSFEFVSHPNRGDT